MITASMDKPATQEPSDTSAQPALPPMTGWLQPNNRANANAGDTLAQRNSKPQPKSRPMLKMALLLLVAVGVGGVAGSLLTRQRYKAKQVVASINGVVVSESDFIHRLEITNGDATLRQIVADELQLQYARKRNVYPSDAEVMAKYKTISEQPSFGQYLTTTHQTPEDVLRGIRLTLAQAALVNQGSAVTDAEVRAFYDKQTNRHDPQARYYTPKTVTIAVITSKNREKIRQAAADLARGMAFAQAAAKHSEDTSKDNGGVLPPVIYGRTPLSRMAGVEDKIFSLQTGQQIGPEQIAGNWWLIRCLDKKPEVTKSFEEVQNECRESALLEKSVPLQANQVQASYLKFMKDANVRAFWPQYKNVISTH